MHRVIPWTTIFNVSSIFSVPCSNCSLTFLLSSFLALSSASVIESQVHTGKCIRRFAGIYVYCRYFIDRKW